MVSVAPLLFSNPIPWWARILLGLFALAGSAYCWLATLGADRAIRKYVGGTFGHPAMFLTAFIALGIANAIENFHKAKANRSKQSPNDRT